MTSSYSMDSNRRNRLSPWMTRTDVGSLNRIILSRLPFSTIKWRGWRTTRALKMCPHIMIESGGKPKLRTLNRIKENMVKYQSWIRPKSSAGTSWRTKARSLSIPNFKNLNRSSRYWKRERHILQRADNQDNRFRWKLWKVEIRHNLIHIYIHLHKPTSSSCQTDSSGAI